MGACLSKKKGSSTKSASTAPHAVTELKNSGNSVIVDEKTEPHVKLKKENNNNKTLEEKHESVKKYEGQVKKEIFIIKHRKSHDLDNREGNTKCLHGSANIEACETMGEKIAPPPPAAAAANVGVLGVRTSSCTKEEVDAILIQCGRLSRNSSGKGAASVSASGECRKGYSGSKRSYDFDHCDNDTISTDEDQKKTNDSSEGDGMVAVAAEKHHQHRQRHRQSPKPSSQGRRRTPSREREQHQRCSSRERRVSKSPVRRSSETTTTPANVASNIGNASSSSSSRPGKMISVPATISSMVMDKSNNVGGGGEFATTTTTGIKRITVKRNVGAASPRSQSPARTNGNATNADKVLSENQKQPSLSRNSSRKAEQSPHRRIPLSEVDHNTLAYPQSSTANNNSSRVQNKPKKEIETQANQKPNVDMNDNSKNLTSSRVELDKGVSANCKTKMQQQEEDVKVHSSMTDNVVVMTVVPPGVDNLKPQTLTRSRSSRRSRDLDHNPEAPQSYTSLLLQDIQNFHQKNTTSVSLPACVTKACSILEAVADLNSTTRSNFSGTFTNDKRNPLTYQSNRNDCNVLLGANQYGKRVPDTKDPFVESEIVVSDDVMEPSLHKYVTVKRGGSLGGVDTTDDQESSGSNSFTVSSGQQQNLSISSWEPNSADSKDCWTSRLNYSKEEGQKRSLGLEGRVTVKQGVMLMKP